MPGQGAGSQGPGIVLDIHSKGITEDSSTREWTLLGFSCKSWVCSPWTFSTKILVPTCETQCQVLLPESSVKFCSDDGRSNQRHVFCLFFCFFFSFCK